MKRSLTQLIVEFFQARGIERVYGLQGGHIQLIWDHLAQRNIDIIDVRDEGAAVHMAHAHSLLTGQLGIVLVTAGPGVTNCVTAMANAQLERIPVLLIGGCAPRAQDDLGPLQGVPHTQIMQPVTQWARTIRVADNALRDLDKAVSLASGDGCVPGPVYVEIPADVLREEVHLNLVLQEHMHPKLNTRIPANEDAVRQAAKIIAQSKKPSVFTGRGAMQAGPELIEFLDAAKAVYLDTQESRGLVPADHPAFVGAMRGRVMQETDLVVVVGRKLDYQMGYGSPAVFPNARFIRIADNWEELSDNRRGEVELFAEPAAALKALARLMEAHPGAPNPTWAAELKKKHVERSARYAESMVSAEPGKDGHMHPNRIFAALQEVLDADAITVADGGDILSFARMGLKPGTYLDSGVFGCLGAGTPYGIAAALDHPDRQVVVISGDGAFGINAMEIDTAKRHGAKVVFIVANNAAWNIERIDQELNYGGRVYRTTLDYSDYAMMARAFGLHAERVTDPKRLKVALEEAFDNAPALLDVVITQHALSSDANKGLGFVPDYQALTAWDEAERERRRE